MHQDKHQKMKHFNESAEDYIQILQCSVFCIFFLRVSVYIIK